MSKSNPQFLPTLFLLTLLAIVLNFIAIFCVENLVAYIIVTQAIIALLAFLTYMFYYSRTSNKYKKLCSVLMVVIASIVSFLVVFFVIILTLRSQNFRGYIQIVDADVNQPVA